MRDRRPRSAGGGGDRTARAAGWDAGAGAHRKSQPAPGTPSRGDETGGRRSATDEGGREDSRRGGTAHWPLDLLQPSSPLYVARGRRIGCEGATDRLPHGPKAPLGDRSIARVVAPLLPTESPNSCPGRRLLRRRARIGKAGPRTEGSTQMTETPTYYAGIDVAKDRLDVVLRPSRRYLEATNDERGIRSMARRPRKENVAPAVLEATGGS